VRAADIDAKHRRSLKPTHVKDLGECRLEFSLCTWRLDWLKIAVDPDNEPIEVDGLMLPACIAVRVLPPTVALNLVQQFCLVLL
jgi:hypothetical protein